MQVVLAEPRGFCAGKTRAIELVERAMAQQQRSVHVIHENALSASHRDPVLPVMRLDGVQEDVVFHLAAEHGELVG